jgi:hypothetical protein
MYFVWRSDAGLADSYMYISDVPVALDHEEWITGGPLLTQPPVVTLIGDSDSPATLSDVILTQFQLPVLSPRAVSVLEKLGVDNIQYFPINLKHRQAKRVDSSYQIANIVGLVYCLDKKHATFNPSPLNENEILWLQQYRILEDQVLHKDAGKKAPLIFRLGEFPFHVLAHESVKAAFDKEKLTGSEFIAPEQFA